MRDRDLSQPRSIHFCISSGRVCRARESENLVNHSRPVWPPMPSRCNIERTDPAGRPNCLAASSTGMVVMRSRRRCCSGFVHSRYARFSLTPNSCRKRKHASRGFPEISASFVTRVRLSNSVCCWLLLVRCLYALIRSLASLGQRNARRLWTLSSSPIVLLPGLGPGGIELPQVRLQALLCPGIPPLLLRSTCPICFGHVGRRRWRMELFRTRTKW